MPTTSFNSRKPEVVTAQREIGRARRVIVWSSFFFALLQSLCTFFAAVDGVRLAIGIGALAVSAGVGATLSWVHADRIRLPMMAIALVGSLLNLIVLMQIWRLRRRPASQWRQTAPSREKIRMEGVQLLLSIITLVLIGVEEYWHVTWHHHL